MPDTVTITGVTGPGLAVGPLVFTDVISFEINLVNSVIVINGSLGATSRRRVEIDVFAQNTITITKTGNDWTISVAA